MQLKAIPTRPLAPRPVSLSLQPVRLSASLSVRLSVPLDSLAQRPQNTKTPGPCRGYCGFHLISLQLSQAYQASTQGLLIKRSRLTGLDLPVFTTLVALLLLERLMMR